MNIINVCCNISVSLFPWLFLCLFPSSQTILSSLAVSGHGAMLGINLQYYQVKVRIALRRLFLSCLFLIFLKWLYNGVCVFMMPFICYWVCVLFFSFSAPTLQEVSTAAVKPKAYDQISNNPVSSSSVQSPALHATSSNQPQSKQSNSQTLPVPFSLPCVSVLELASTGTSNKQ